MERKHYFHFSVRFIAGLAVLFSPMVAEAQQTVRGIKISTDTEKYYYRISNMRIQRLNYSTNAIAGYDERTGEADWGDVYTIDRTAISRRLPLFLPKDFPTGVTYESDEYNDIINSVEPGGEGDMQQLLKKKGYQGFKLTPQPYLYPYMGLADYEGQWWCGFSAQNDVIDHDTTYWYFTSTDGSKVQIHNAVIEGTIKRAAGTNQPVRTMGFDTADNNNYYYVIPLEDLFEEEGFEMALNDKQLNEAYAISTSFSITNTGTSCLDMCNFINYTVTTHQVDPATGEPIPDVELKYGFVGMERSWSPLRSNGVNENHLYNNGSTFLIEEADPAEALAAIENFNTKSVEIDGITYEIQGGSASVTDSSYEIEEAKILTQCTIKGVVYPVTSIGASAFAYRKNLHTVVIPSSIGAIGNSAFSGCTALKSLTFEATNCTSCGSPSAPAFPATISSLTIGNKVTIIPAYFLYGGSKIERLTIPASVATIGEHAFSPSHNMPKVFWLRATPPSIECEIPAIVNYVVSDGYNFDNQAVYPLLGSMFTVDGFTYVPVNLSDMTCDILYGDCSQQDGELVIDNKVSNAEQVFTVLNIGQRAFYGCNAIETANIDNIGSIGDSAFEGCSKLNDLTLGKSITAIGEYCFAGCTSLASARIGSGIPAIPGYAFADCSSLDNLVIPNNVKSIGNYAFLRCVSLRNITIEDAAPNADDGTILPVSLSLVDWTSSNHDDDSISDKEYEFTAEPGDELSFDYSVNSEKNYDWFTVKLNGIEIISKSGKESGSYSTTFTETADNILYVSYVKDNSYSDGLDKASITNIILNRQNVKVSGLFMGSNGSSPLFSACPLDSVYIGREISDVVGFAPFSQNKSLRSVEIGDAVTAISKSAFMGCSSLDRFYAGSNIESIGEEAFSDCTAMKNYYSTSAEPPVCGNNALADINKTECTLTVPTGSKEKYMVADQWKDFFIVNEATAIDSVEADGGVSIEAGVGAINVFNAQGCEVSVYGIDGTVQSCFVADTPTTSCKVLPGIYIVKAGARVEKISVK